MTTTPKPITQVLVPTWRTVTTTKTSGYIHLRYAPKEPTAFMRWNCDRTSR